MEYKTFIDPEGPSYVTDFTRVIAADEVSANLREKCQLILSYDEAQKINQSSDLVRYQGLEQVRAKMLKDAGINVGVALPVEQVLEIEYGSYPQDLVDDEMRMKLEVAFSQRKNVSDGICETGKSYTIMYPRTELKKYKEFAFEGERYVRVAPATDMYVGDREIKANKPVWFKVKPIVWLNSAEGNFKTSTCLFPGRFFAWSYGKCVGKDEWEPKFEHWFREKFTQEILPPVSTVVDTQEMATAKNRRRSYGITIEEAPMSVKEQIAFYINTGKSFMLHGPSGCGKTRRIHDIDPDFTAVPFVKGCMPEQIVGKVVYPNGKVMSPVDAEGKAVELPNGGIWMPPEWYVDICKKCEAEPDKMHVVFIDEVTNGSESSQSLLFQIVERKSVTGSHGKLPKNSVVVLAGNSKEESGAAYNMPEPLFRRAHGHIYLTPNVPDWLEWGSEKSTSHPDEEGRLNIHPLVSAFVAAYGKDCFYTEFDEECPKYTMDPRGWEQISDIIYDNNGVIRKELLVSKMGKEFAATFFEFAKNPPITAEEVIADDIEGLSIPQRPDEKLALIYGLRHVNERQVGKVRGFVYRHLGKESAAIFDKMWCEDNPERALFLKRLDDKLKSGAGR